jgi:[protein-PII] uridylyltransferase
MKTLLEMIDEDAKKRLRLPEGKLPHDNMVRYRRYVKAWRQQLQVYHRDGYSGLEVCQAQTRVLDAMLIRLYQDVKRIYQEESGEKKVPAVALVALGGYGRRELNPFSDIDLMFLHDGQLLRGEEQHPFLKLIVEHILYTLYDIPFKVGHSVRTLNECVEVANQDMLAKTSLIETRRIAGNRSLYSDLQKRIQQECIRHHEHQYIRDRQEDQVRRHEKYGNSPTMLEPDLKNGCGGLRDFHNLIWLAWFKLHTWNLDDLRKNGHLTERELTQVRKAHDFLLRVRNDLHYLTNRATDILFKAVQPTVAKHLGFKDKSPARRIEKFMKELYTHMRNIHLISNTLEQRFALAPEKGILPSLTSLFRRKSYTIDGFRVVDGWVRAPQVSVFLRDPGRLMRLFLMVQQRGLSMHPDLIHRLRELVSLSNDDFRRNPLVRDTFLDILHQRGAVAPILRIMHETGLLGDYLPEFGKLTCLVQHEFFHRYAADEHTLVCIEELDKVWQAKEQPYSQFEEIFQKIENPHILYLALLLHDVGKGARCKGKHDEASTAMAERVADRMGLDEVDKELLVFLVENHLYLFQVATQKDVYSSAVIQEVANHMETPERLNLLFLLSFADTLGTSKSLWTGFKELLLWAIYKRTMNMLAEPEAGQEAAGTIRQRNHLLRQLTQIADNSFSLEEIERHLNLMPERYRRVFSPKQIIRHLNMIFSLQRAPQETGPLQAICKIAWERLLHQGCSRVTVCAHHQRGLFNKICGALTASGLTIFNAQIFVRQDGIALDSFHVLSVDETGLPSVRQREAFKDVLEDALCDAVNLEELMRKCYTNRPSFEQEHREHFSIPTKVTFDLENSRKYTAVQVQSEDYIGLLYVLTRALSQLGADIISSSNITEKGVVIDRFLITDCIGNKITEPERLKAMEASLHKAVEALKQQISKGRRGVSYSNQPETS